MPAIPGLTPRLRLAAGFVRKNTAVADIGTDHAYLPAYLVGGGFNPRALACDLRSGPLGHANETVARCSLQRQIELRLSDGLDAVKPDEAADIVIAGMGGDLIAEIIGRCAWLRDKSKHLVLQPMTAEERLRGFLCRGGFQIDREAVAREGRKLYLVMSVSYTGAVRAADEFYCYTGLLPETGGVQEGDFLRGRSRELYKKAAGLKKSGMHGNAALALQAEKLADAISAAADHLTAR